MSATEWGFIFGLWTGLVVGCVSALLWVRSRDRTATHRRKLAAAAAKAAKPKARVDKQQLNRWLRGEL
jgi:hypothetical protein